MDNERKAMLSTAEVIPRLPDRHGGSCGDALPDQFEGATIVRFGTFAERTVEGGGLVIEYRQPDSDKVRRVVLAFNELGMWVEHGPETTDPPSTEPRYDSLTAIDPITLEVLGM